MNRKDKCLIHNYHILMILSAFVLMLSVIIINPQETKAASSYSNAREFFYSTSSDKDTGSFHMEVVDGTVYYATRGKTASPTSTLKYYTIGFDVTLSGGGQSVSFSLKRGGSLSQVGSEISSDDGYTYVLYQIPKDTLIALGEKVNPTAMAIIESSDNMWIHMWGILTTKKGSTINASCEENGSGGLIFSGSPVWHMNNTSDVSAAKKVFSGHTFTDYIDLNKPISNPTYSIVYNANSGKVSSSYQTSSSGLIQTSSGSTVTTTKHLFQNATLLDVNTVGLSKTGYHLVSGEEWVKYGTSTSYKSNGTYSTGELMPGGIVSSIMMKANWKPNTYYIKYDANGGSGTMKTSTYTYDVTGKLSKNTYTRTGYEFVGWSYAKTDDMGLVVSDEATVKNWTDENEKTITLYAIWKPAVYTITEKTMTELIETDENTKITTGTTSFYELYDKYYGFKYSSSEDTIAKFLETYDALHRTSSGFTPVTSETTSITVPTVTGYNFLGYYRGIYGTGDKVVSGVNDSVSGKILTSASYYTSDTTIYANWEAKQFTITFHKEGGSGGTDTATATYGKDLPLANAPTRDGYTFMGYYTEKNGKGTCYYDENMSGQLKYMLESDLDLYAYWVDDIAPTITAVATPDSWSNGIRGYGTGIDIIITAYDKGVGLKHITLYYSDGTVAAEYPSNGKNYDKGTTTVQVNTFNNTKEGITRFRAVATDWNGNESEAVTVSYYDITAPTGEVRSDSWDGQNLEIDDLYVDDWNTKNN